MRVTSFGSSSSGNAFLIEAGPQRRTKVLVDAGFTGRVLVERMRKVGVSPEQLSSVLVTHEHTDHILGLPLLKKRFAVPILADSRTLSAIEQVFAEGVCRADSGALVPVEVGWNDEMHGDACTGTELSGWRQGRGSARGIQSRPLHFEVPTSLPVGSSCQIGDIEVRSFPVSHDAVAPCGYLLSAGGCRVCVVIDSGEVTTTMLEAMREADLLVLESNHDRQKLLRGPYPYALKQRILSTTGHLSNDQAAEAVLRTWRTDGLRWLWLSHLSRTNNTPAIARNSMLSRITAAKGNPAQVHITTLPPGMGSVWDSAQLWQMASLWEM
jgi:phosphoribosyl 1,2-cyclic phosphodiesterase